MAKRKIRPHLVVASEDGELFDHPELLMVTRRGGEIGLPRPDELIPLPEESELFLLEGRRALGLNPGTGSLQAPGELAVAAFISPGHTLAGHAAFTCDAGAPVLPLFAYGAVGYAEDRFFVAAKRVDRDMRQVFARIDPERVRAGAQRLMKRFPDNRLVRHLAGCALTYGCPAAKNLALGRFEAPLPTSRACNARCVGCISEQEEASGFPATQDRIAFTPSPAEIVEVMQAHDARAKRPIHSFGQGCEGEPLTEAATIAEAVRRYREAHGQGTVNVNTNAGLPGAVAELAAAGIDSIRVSINSADPALYERYYRPRGYAFTDVAESVATAKAAGLFVSLNFLFFPGVSDGEHQYEALAGLIRDHRVDFVQLRNLNLDPDLYLKLAAGIDPGPAMGLSNFMKRLKKDCPWLVFGYFNPWLDRSDGKGAVLPPS